MLVVLQKLVTVRINLARSLQMLPKLVTVRVSFASLLQILSKLVATLSTFVIFSTACATCIIKFVVRLYQNTIKNILT